MSARRIETLRLIQLEAFLAVAAEGSYSAGARLIGIDQSSATRYVQQLEVWLKKPLLTDDTPFALTAQGDAFVEVALSVVRQLQDFRAKLPGENVPLPPPISPRDIKI